MDTGICRVGEDVNIGAIEGTAVPAVHGCVAAERDEGGAQGAVNGEDGAAVSAARAACGTVAVATVASCRGVAGEGVVDEREGAIIAEDAASEAGPSSSSPSRAAGAAAEAPAAGIPAAVAQGAEAAATAAATEAAPTTSSVIAAGATAAAKAAGAAAGFVCPTVTASIDPASPAGAPFLARATDAATAAADVTIAIVHKGPVPAEGHVVGERNTVRRERTAVVVHRPSQARAAATAAAADIATTTAVEAPGQAARDRQVFQCQRGRAGHREHPDLARPVDRQPRCSRAVDRDIDAGPGNDVRRRAVSATRVLVAGGQRDRRVVGHAEIDLSMRIIAANSGRDGGAQAAGAAVIDVRDHVIAQNEAVFQRLQSETGVAAGPRTVDSADAVPHPERTLVLKIVYM